MLPQSIAHFERFSTLSTEELSKYEQSGWVLLDLVLYVKRE
jgi:hypothetical protein